ncbi:MAG: efflux RND transporter periplasmic adaptor subunit [SAR324 cluster bacterium]|nr:efflux RND transporter periplasmic adaptor subunit [SAR324 cluster bacterium]
MNYGSKAVMLCCFILGFAIPGFSIESEIFVVESVPKTKTLELVGTIKPVREIQFQAKTAGVIEKIAIVENQMVKQGQLLMTLENQTQRLQLDIAKSQLEINQLTLKDADVQFKDAEKQYRDEKQLYENGTISKARLDQLELQWKKAQIRLDSAKQSVVLTKNEIQLREKAILDTSVQSPFSALVNHLYVTQDEIVAAGKVLVHLMDMQAVEIESGISEEEFSVIQQGQDVSFRVLAFPGMEFPGKIIRVGWELNTQTRRFPVFIGADNPESKLRSGMTAQISLNYHLKGLVRIPVNSVLYDQQMPYVRLYKNTEIVKQPVTIDDVRPDGVYVKYGLQAGDKIIITR